MDRRVEVARTMRITHGWGYKRLARHFGVSRDSMRAWLRIVDGRQRRGARFRYRAICKCCGLPCTGETCDSCIAVRHFNRRQDIEQRYLQGHPLQTIADDLGHSRKYIGKEVSIMRNEGWALPYRLPRRA